MLEDLRDCPGTMGLTSAWVLVFALILVVQWQAPTPAPASSMVGPLPASMMTTHRFGDMTWTEVRHGEVWRLVTATFVHYSLLHLGMNVMSLIMLGRLVEPWYGPGPFLGICLAIGGLGNLAGGLLRQGVAMARPWVVDTAIGRHWPGLFDRFFHVGPGGPVNIPSGGGSTIVLGLIALAAVVGWRSKTRIGRYLSKQMMALLGFTALLGVVFYSLIDNYGHAGGAIVGASIGLVHRPLLRLAERRSVRKLAWLAVGGLTLACLAAAVRDDRAERSVGHRLFETIQRGQKLDQVVVDVEHLYRFYGRVIVASPDYRDPFNELDSWAVADLLARVPSVANPSKPEPGQPDFELTEVAAILERLGQRTTPPPWSEVTDEDLERLRLLGLAALEASPRFDQVYDFVVSYRSALKELAAEIGRIKTELAELDRLARATR